MAELVDMKDKIKRYYFFTKAELRGLIIAIFVIAFIISFKDWGKDSVNVASGFFNLFNSILIVALSMLIHISAQRVWSLATGYRLEWRMWSFGLLIGLIFVFLSNGNIWMILPGGIVIHHMAGHRLGWFRYGINYWALALIALSGPLASITMAVLFKALSGVIANSLIQKLIIFNIAYALFSLLPIPPLDGSRTFFGSRMLYSFSTFAIIAASVLLMLDISLWLAVVSSFFIGVVLWILYYVFFEHKAWEGA